MFVVKRPSFRSAIILLIFVTVFLTACGSRVQNANWPGLSADDQKVYLAYGPAVHSYVAETQELAWSFPAEPSAGLQFYSPPDVSDGQVAFGDYGQSGGFLSPQVVVSVYSVENTDSGASPDELWKNSEDVNDKIVASPLQVGDQVFVGTADNHVLSLERATGATEWIFTTGHSIWGQPAYRDGILYVASMDRSVYALDGDSGDLIWQTTFDGALASSPVLNDNLVYVSSFDGQVHALDSKTGESRWAAFGEGAIWGAPAYANGVVYFSDVIGNLFAADAVTGDIKWQQKAVGAVQTSPVVVGDKVYLASEGASAEVPVGALTAFAIDDGRQLWQQIAPAPLFTTPVVVDDKIIVALSSEQALLIAYNLETGAILWEIPPPAEG